jgi:hypothetical protein
MDSLKILSPTYRLTLTTSASNALQLVPNTPTRNGGDYLWHDQQQHGYARGRVERLKRRFYSWPVDVLPLGH